MREFHGRSRQRVACLRRATAGLAIASLLALGSGPLFHAAAPPVPSHAVAIADSQSAGDGASLPHGAAHLPGLCSICRAVGQSRLGLHPTSIANVDPLDAVAPEPLQPAPDAATRSPWLASIAPRAPPRALPVQNS
jgi:hypothetical protein